MNENFIEDDIDYDDDINNSVKELIQSLVTRVSFSPIVDPVYLNEFYQIQNSTETLFMGPVTILNCSIRQLLKFEFNTAIKSTNYSTLTFPTDHVPSSARFNRTSQSTKQYQFYQQLNKRLEWIQQRKHLCKQLSTENNLKTRTRTTSTNNNSEMYTDHNKQQIDISRSTINSLISIESDWIRQRLKLIDHTLAQLKRPNDNDTTANISEYDNCARCRIYETEQPLTKKYKPAKQRQQKDRKCQTKETAADFQLQLDPEYNIILSLSKIADRIGHDSSKCNGEKMETNEANSLSRTTRKTKQRIINTLLQATSTNDLLRTSSRTQSSESQTNSNSSSMDIKRKGTSSPCINPLPCPLLQSSFSTTSHNSNEILTPLWRGLTSKDLDLFTYHLNDDFEDVSDDSYIHRHLHCEQEQELWLHDPSTSSSHTTTSRQHSSSTSKLNGSHSAGELTNHKQQHISHVINNSQTSQKRNQTSNNQTPSYRYRLAANGVAYTETIEKEPDTL
ncbi:unnamed protein product [Didymodactylos carnosus]|uniref:Uncharacterized protein n=1 Tax=Didymodactylos carnosus TaxID=1234261 RepID=A0A813PYA5_9BILA|nr:unnamed protein product [Didymodactylos carnosus]CAF3535815.1 unnamed protein product [Didymodactylos carnosus]